MNHNSKLEGMLAMTIGMSTNSAAEGLEVVQNAEQNRARSNCKLPLKMYPSQKAFEALGFTFEDIGDDVLCKATLPDGWSLKSDDDYWTYLIDEKGRKRGIYFYKGSIYDRNGHMDLCQRFYVTYKVANSKKAKGPYTVLAKDVEGNIVFTAGKCKKLYSDEYEELMRKAKEYLHTNYPEWEDPTKYWD